MYKQIMTKITTGQKLTEEEIFSPHRRHQP